MLERLINVTKTTFFIKNDNFLLKIKNSSQYVLQFLYKHTGAKCYYFSGDKLYIHSRFSPIPIEKIENITIKKYSQADRSYGFKVLVKLKGKRLRQQFRLGIAGFIRTDLQKLHDDLIKDFRKRKIEYKYR